MASWCSICHRKLDETYIWHSGTKVHKGCLKRPTNKGITKPRRSIMNWNKVEDRLPEVQPGKYSIQVLVTMHDPVFAEITKGHGCFVDSVTYAPEEGFIQLECGGDGAEWGPTCAKVIAWMYLPEPYVME